REGADHAQRVPDDAGPFVLQHDAVRAHGPTAGRAHLEHVLARLALHDVEAILELGCARVDPSLAIAEAHVDAPAVRLREVPELGAAHRSTLARRDARAR